MTLELQVAQGLIQATALAVELSKKPGAGWHWLLTKTRLVPTKQLLHVAASRQVPQV